MSRIVKKAEADIITALPKIMMIQLIIATDPNLPAFLTNNQKDIQADLQKLLEVRMI